ncbi:hypothetical protein E2C01_070667 [Portunus trituberculatus]|uniref:Uncharacterized protein n=1 Tax=Portunus trituberculatus TaxID=210409 RepID=A0A5B7HUS4_PORTR|nr:hypothetical protein [Portunus trituberculatus]
MQLPSHFIPPLPRPASPCPTSQAGDQIYSPGHKNRILRKAKEMCHYALDGDASGGLNAPLGGHTKAKARRQ